MNMFWMQLFIIENFFFLDAVMQPIGKFVRKWCWIVTVYLWSLFINRDCVNQNDKNWTICDQMKPEILRISYHTDHFKIILRSNTVIKL